MGIADVRDGVYDIQNVRSGLYLNVAGGSMRGGANVWVWDNPKSEDSTWQLKRGVDGTYTLKNTKTGHYLSVAGNGDHLGANVEADTSAEGNASRWILDAVPNGDGSAYTWKNVKTGLFLNAAGGATAKGTNVQVWDNPGSTHSQWELIGLECRDATPGEKCYDDAHWAKETGIHTRPDWYPELSADSSLSDFQAHLHFCFWKRCPLPCTVTDLHNCSIVGRFWNMDGCKDAAVGSQCDNETKWAMETGLKEYPDWYEGLDNTSNKRQFQARLFQGEQTGLETNHCPAPCCHDTLPGELCHEEAMWALHQGLHLPGFDWVYPPSLTKDSAFAEFQAYLHLCYPKRCPEPCATTKLMVQAGNLTLHCPDA